MTQISIYCQTKDYRKSTLDQKNTYTQVCAFTKKIKILIHTYCILRKTLLKMCTVDFHIPHVLTGGAKQT